MEKPGNWFAIVKCEKNTRRKDFRKRICIFTWEFTLGQFSVPACVNQLPGLSVRGTSTPNVLFQTINGIKVLMGYTKQFYQLKHGVLFHLKIENLELSVNY